MSANFSEKIRNTNCLKYLPLSATGIELLLLLQEYILQAQDLLEDGSSIAQSGCADSISVKEMCKVLKSNLDAFTTKLEERRVSLVTCTEFHQMVREVLSLK